MKELVVFGAGGHSYAVIALIQSLSQYKPIAIYDSAPKEENIFEIPVYKHIDQNLIDLPMVIAIGGNSARKMISEKFDAFYPSFTHKSAVVYDSASVGKGSVIFPNAVVDADASLGDFCIVNNNATVSHNVRIGHFCHIAINAAIAGGVTIGEGTLLGAGSVVLPEIKIGKGVTIGAGSIVTKDVPDFSKVYGNPARIIQ